MDTVALPSYLQAAVLFVTGTVGSFVITGVLKKVIPFFQQQDAGRKARIMALAGVVSIGLVVLKNFLDGVDDPQTVQNFLVSAIEAIGLWLGATATHQAAKPTVAIEQDVKIKGHDVTVSPTA